MAQRGFSSLWAPSTTAGWAVTCRNSQPRRDWSMATTTCKTFCCFLWRSSQRMSLRYRHYDVTHLGGTYFRNSQITLTFYTSYTGAHQSHTGLCVWASDIHGCGHWPLACLDNGCCQTFCPQAGHSVPHISAAAPVSHWCLSAEVKEGATRNGENNIWNL